jgi:hypothetical protein
MKLIHGVVACALLAGSATMTAAAQDKPAVKADGPKAAEPTYRLNYTITESDGAKKVGVQHFGLTINLSSPRGTMKLGSKVPVMTGSYSAGAAGAGAQTQMTYLDVGLNIDTRLTPAANGVLVDSKVEQSSIAEATAASQDPVVRQAVLQSTALLEPGKSVTLGSLDTPGSTRHLDIEVVLELVK